jgi:hypothetical protein
MFNMKKINREKLRSYLEKLNDRDYLVFEGKYPQLIYSYSGIDDSIAFSDGYKSGKKVARVVRSGSKRLSWKGKSSAELETHARSQEFIEIYESEAYRSGYLKAILETFGN